MKAKDDRITALESKVAELSNTEDKLQLQCNVDNLIEKCDEFEQGQKANNVVIHGLDIQTFAEAVNESNQPGTEQAQITEPRDMKFFTVYQETWGPDRKGRH